MLAFLKPQQRGFIALRLSTPKDHSQFSPRKESVTGCFHHTKLLAMTTWKRIFFKFHQTATLQQMNKCTNS